MPRERFSQAPESLQTILEYTHIPFNLIVVDCNTPRGYWQRMESLLRGRPNVKIIHTDHHLLPNQCRNLVIKEAQDEFLCLIENDNLVDEGWLSRFLNAIEKYRADVVIPLMMEVRHGETKVHFDQALGYVRTVETADGIKWEIVHRQWQKERDLGGESRPQEFMETHCLFFRRNIFDRIGLFDEELNTSEEIDVSLALYKAKVPAVFVPECVIRYIPPPTPVCAEDRAYFLMKWNIPRATRSHERIQSKWNLIRMPQLLGFVEERNLRGSDSLRLWREEIANLISPGESFILVDMQQWYGSEIIEGLSNLPFLERHRQYWGAPADAVTAIEELERLRRSGARLIVFAWHAFWWFDYYSAFYRYLRSRYPRVLENTHLVAFDLKRTADSTLGES